MEIKFITEKNVDAPTNHCSLAYTADASSLGWKPGYFPETIKTSLGNKLDFVRHSMNADKVIYEQVAGCISLVVFND